MARASATDGLVVLSTAADRCYDQAVAPCPLMSEEQLNAFLEKVKADNSLLEKLKEAASPEAVLEIAKEAGFSITAEDFQSMQSATVEVSDEELEAAAGGGGGIIKASIKMGKGATICATPYIVAISVRHC